MKKNLENEIETALKKEPAFKLSKDFSYNVVKALRAKEKRAQRRIYFWMLFGIVFMCGSGALLVVGFFPDLLSTFSPENQVNSLIPMAVVVGVLVVLIQYLDKRLIKDRLVMP